MSSSKLHFAFFCTIGIVSIVSHELPCESTGRSLTWTCTGSEKPFPLIGPRNTADIAGNLWILAFSVRPSNNDMFLFGRYVNTDIYMNSGTDTDSVFMLAYDSDGQPKFFTRGTQWDSSNENILGTGTYTTSEKIFGIVKSSAKNNLAFTIRDPDDGSVILAKKADGFDSLGESSPNAVTAIGNAIYVLG